MVGFFLPWLDIKESNYGEKKSRQVILNPALDSFQGSIDVGETSKDAWTISFGLITNIIQLQVVGHVIRHQRAHTFFPQQVTESFLRFTISHQHVDAADIPQADHGVATELGVVAGQHDLARIADQGLGHPHFLVIEIQQGTDVVDAGNADDAVVRAELLHEVGSGLADDAAIAAAHLASGDNDVEIFLATDRSEE